MKKISRILLAVFILFIGLLTVKYFLPTDDVKITNEASVKKEINFDYSNLKLDNKATILMNMNTNQVIYENNIDQPLPVYSVSKIMFLASVSDELKKEKISLDKKVRVPKLIDDVNKNANFSSANLKSGQVYTIRELYEATMIPSGNDAAIMLAYSIFKNHSNAVTKMNENAKKWGMKNSSFVTTSGLDGKYLRKLKIKAENGKNLMSVYDSVILLKKIMSDFPEIIEAGSKTNTVIGAGNQIKSVNKIMDGLEYGYDGVYGLKTGSNMENYSNNIIALKKNEYDQDIAAISFDSKTRETLYKDVANLYDYLKGLKLSNVKDNLNLAAKFIYVDKQPKIALEKDYYLYHPNDSNFIYNLANYSPLYDSHLGVFKYGPKNSKLGTLDIKENDLFFDGKPLNLSDVVISEDVKEANFFNKIIKFISAIIYK